MDDSRDDLNERDNLNEAVTAIRATVNSLAASSGAEDTKALHALQHVLRDAAKTSRTQDPFAYLMEQLGNHGDLAHHKGCQNLRRELELSRHAFSAAPIEKGGKTRHWFLIPKGLPATIAGIGVVAATAGVTLNTMLPRDPAAAARQTLDARLPEDQKDIRRVLLATSSVEQFINATHDGTPLFSEEMKEKVEGDLRALRELRIKEFDGKMFGALKFIMNAIALYSGLASYAYAAIRKRELADNAALEAHIEKLLVQELNNAIGGIAAEPQIAAASR